MIQLQNPEQARQLQAVFVNEADVIPLTGLRLKVPLKLATPAYIAGRDATEIEQDKQIQTLIRRLNSR